ncbi:MAG: SusC/RagA family TonB-linked outer membrane protein, partial [Dysgonamonadaceae bacterium]|nr:SusC/RagA family TonB-linked outer membrane protein [Dysgonamonadaceae bacterium]
IGINGSENFPKNSRFGIFPALSLAWLVSDEPFMDVTEELLTHLKLRMSYGEVGNDRDIRRFLYLPTTYSSYPAAYQFYFGEPTTNYGSILPIQEGVAPNYNVTWERTRKFNTGVDLSLIDKISIGFDVFAEKRSDILTTMQTIPSFQFLQIQSDSRFVAPNLLSPQNYAKTETNGFELELGYDGKINRDFRYMFKGTYAYAKQRWTQLSETYQPYPWMYSQGYSVGEIRGLVADGFWDSYDEINDPRNPYVTFNPNPIPGDIRYKDINGDMKIDRYDVIPKGKTGVPRSTVTFTTELNWKNFDFSVLFQGATDLIFVPNEENRVMMNEGWGSYTWIRDRWTPQTRDGYYPVLHSVNNVSQSNFQSSTFWEYDATYLRLKNLELGYTIPKDAIKKVGVNDMRVYVTGQNLFTWTPFSKMMNRYDPESRTGRLIYYPVMNVYNVGISLTF